GLSTDILGHVYVTGVTSSNSGIATSGAYQSAIGLGQNSFLAKFNTSGSLSWATYISANGATTGANTYSLSAAADYFGDIYITGASGSGIASAGAFQTSGYGAFLAKFSGGGARQWATLYGGNDGREANSVCIDASSNV